MTVAEFLQGIAEKPHPNTDDIAVVQGEQIGAFDSFMRDFYSRMPKLPPIVADAASTMASGVSSVVGWISSPFLSAPSGSATDRPRQDLVSSRLKTAPSSGVRHHPVPRPQAALTHSDAMGRPLGTRSRHLGAHPIQRLDAVSERADVAPLAGGLRLGTRLMTDVHQRPASYSGGYRY